MNKVLVLFAADGAGLGDRVSTQLRAGGFDVSHGDTLEDLSALAATVVVWTPGAAANENICAIARHEKAERRLVPVTITTRDAPSGFEDLPPIQLQGWAGEANDPRWRFVLDEVGLACGDRHVVEELQKPTTRKYSPYAPRPNSVDAPNNVGPVATRSPIYPPRRQTASAGDVVTDVIGRLARLPARLREPQIALTTFAALLLAVGVTSFGLGLGRGKTADEAIAASVAQKNAQQETQDIASATRAEALDTDESVAAPSLSFVQPAEVAESRPDDLIETTPLASDDVAARQVDATTLGAAADSGATEMATLEQPTIDDANRDPGSEATTNAASTFPPSPSLASASRPLEAAADNSAVPSLTEDADGYGVALDDVDDPIAQLAWNATTAADAQNAEAEFVGNYFKECLDCPSMAVIAPDPADESTAEFAISIRPVSGIEWRACVADGVCAGGGPQGASPVNATYGDVLAYTAWLSSKTGGDYRAPSAAEWAMSSSPYYGVEGMRALENEWWVTSASGGTVTPGAGASRRPFRVVRILY